VYSHHEPLMMLVEAYARLATGERERAHDLLAQALRRGRAAQSASSFRWLVKGLRRLLAVALTHDVERDIARWLVAEFGITAESQEIEYWPWPVRIRSLGGFAVSIDGMPLRSQRKAQKKPLELLKVVVAQGAQQVSAAQVTQMLWPDAEGDAAADALEVTLRRLRKLLGREDVIALADGRLSLNPGRCWLDLWSFEQTRSRADSLRSQGAPALTDGELEALGERLLAVYTGHFLAGEDETAWRLGTRQRLASQMFRALAAIGRLWEARGASERAELIYRRGIELDVLSVSLQRLLSAQEKRRDL
jgi:LuxR family transcriptional regulator, maltose regulon positive regulatory protein